MKRKSIKMSLTLLLMVVVSCDEPETVVTNYVHPDGSVTRKIEMRSTKKDFKKSDLQVPFDSTWTVNNTLEINAKGDTTWIESAVKDFKNTEEINNSYKTDSGANREIRRQAIFNKRFKWFNTEYRFSERIDKKLSFGYSVKDFLNSDELIYFYSPEFVKQNKENGPDSLKFRSLADSVKHKTDEWTIKNLVSGWIDEFSKLTEGKAGGAMTRESLKARENEFLKIVEQNAKDLDSLWSKGILLKEFIGEANALKYKADADTAFESVVEDFTPKFNEYSVRIAMPGKLIGTNGFIDSSKVLFWPVKSDFFLVDQYDMWAESKIPNRWAWIVSGLFLVFVLTGVIVRRKKAE